MSRVRGMAPWAPRPKMLPLPGSVLKILDQHVDGFAGLRSVQIAQSASASHKVIVTASTANQTSRSTITPPRLGSCFGRQRFPRADVAVGDVGPVAELGGGADGAVERDGGLVVALVGVGVVAAERNPALAELAATAAALNAIQHRRTRDLAGFEGRRQVAQKGVEA